MKFLADENCDIELVNALRADGHDILYVMESLRGASDEIILHRAFIEERILITEDKNFGELVYRLRRQTRGILLLRFAVKTKQTRIKRLREIFVNQGEHLYGSFVVLDEKKARIRPLRV